MGILVFSEERGDDQLRYARLLKQPDESVAFFDKQQSIHDEELTIIAHSSDGFLSSEPEYVGGHSPENFAKKLAKKYGDKKQTLEHLYLLSCEAGLWRDGRPPLAQAFANELFEQGFTNIKVHAITPPRDISAQGGQVVQLIELAGSEPGAEISSYVYASDEHRELDDKLSTVHPRDLKKSLTETDYQLAKQLGYKFKVSVVSQLDRDSYRSRMNVADCTYVNQPTREPRHYHAQHAKLLASVARQIDELSVIEEKKRRSNRQSSIDALKEFYRKLVVLVISEDDPVKEQLTQALRAERETIHKAGYQRFRQNKNHLALDFIDDALDTMGAPAPKPRGIIQRFVQPSSVDEYNQAHAACAELIEQIRAITEIPSSLKSKIEGVNRIPLKNLDEQTATENLAKIEALKEALEAALKECQTRQVKQELAEINKLIIALESHASSLRQDQVTAKVERFRSTHDSMNVSHDSLAKVRSLASEITKYENTELISFKWPKLQQQFSELRATILKHESIVCGQEIKLDRGRIDNDILKSDKILTVLNVMNHTFSTSREHVQEQTLQKAEGHLETLKKHVTELESDSYQAVLKLIEKFDSKSHSFFSINCKKKARMIREAVKKVDANHRDRVLENDDVLSAINYQRISFFCCSTKPTRSFEEVKQYIGQAR